MPKENEKEKAHNRHDTNFKHNFGNINVARDFMKYNLPKEVLDMVDLDTLKKESTEFIPSDNRGGKRADLLYSMETKDDNKTYVLIHLEAHSTSRKYIVARAWEYHPAIAIAHLEGGAEKIPLIITFIFYNGQAKWKGPVSIAGLFEDPELYFKVAMKLPCVIVLDNLDAKALEKQDRVGAAQIIMKSNVKGNPNEMLPHLYATPQGKGLMDKENIDYMAGTNKKGLMPFLKELGKFEPQRAKDYQDMFEAAVRQEAEKREMKALIQGELKGRKEGLQEGRQEGRKEGRQAIKSLLAQGFITEAQAQQALKKLCNPSLSKVGYAS